MYINKRLIAIAAVCAMAVSMSACSDESDKKKDGEIQTVTLSSEEAAEMMTDSFSIQEFTEGNNELGQDPVEQDPVEGGNESSSADAEQGSIVNPDDVSSVVEEVDLTMNEVENNNNNSDDNAQTNSSAVDSSSSAVDNNNNTPANGNDNSSSEGGALIDAANKKIQQAFWMNLNGDFVFEDEFITAQFKIKEGTPNGTYPITIEWLDFANIKGVSLDDVTGVDGSIVVGGAAETNEFAADGFQVKADCVNGNAGDTVTVSFRIKNNPGICASVFRFGYDSSVLEYVSGDKGAAFLNALDTQNN